MSYKSKEWHTGDMFTPEDATEMSQAIEDNEVVANPELEGDEPELTGLLIGKNKYKAGAGGTEVPIVESLPETGEEGDLVVLKNTAENNYLLYCYDDDRWSVVAPSITANPKHGDDEKILNGLEMGGTKYQVGPVRYDMGCLAIEANLNPLTNFNLDAVELGNQIAKTIDDLDEIILDTSFIDSTYIQIMYGQGNNTVDSTVIQISVSALLEDSKDFSFEIIGEPESSKYIEFKDSEGSWFPTGYEGQLTFRHLIQILEHISSDGVIDVIPSLTGSRTNRIIVCRDVLEEYESFIIPDLIEFVSTVFVPAGGSSSSSSSSSS